MKGRSTTRIGIRLEDWVVEALQRKAGSLSVGGYIKGQIMKSVSGSTTKLCDPGVHKPGDTVLVRKGKRLVQTIVPDLDADGSPIPKM